MVEESGGINQSRMSRISITQSIRDFLRSTKENELVGGYERAMLNVWNVKSNDFCGGIEIIPRKMLTTFDTSENLIYCFVAFVCMRNCIEIYEFSRGFFTTLPWNE